MINKTQQESTSQLLDYFETGSIFLVRCITAKIDDNGLIMNKFRVL